MVWEFKLPKNSRYSKVINETQRYIKLLFQLTSVSVLSPLIPYSVLEWDFMTFSLRTKKILTIWCHCQNRKSIFWIPQDCLLPIIFSCNCVFFPLPPNLSIPYGSHIKNCISFFTISIFSPNCACLESYCRL